MTHEQVPGLNQQLNDLETLVDMVRCVDSALAITAPELQSLVAGSQLAHIGRVAYTLAIDVGIDNVTSGRVSRRATADDLQMSSYTLQRLMDERRGQRLGNRTPKNVRRQN